MPVLASSTPLYPFDEFSPDLPTQAYLGDSGIALGERVLDDSGCRWNWLASNAWGPKPSPREQVGDRAAADGQWDATRYYGPRVLPLMGSVDVPAHHDLHVAEQRLREAIGVNRFLFRVTEPGFDGYAWMRQQGDLTWTEVSQTHASFATVLYAPDPRIYSSQERTFGPLLFPVTSGGLVWPTTWPATWNAEVVAGSEVLTNPGSLPVGMQLRVDGPADSLAITLVETGDTLHIDNPDGGPVLQTDEWLTIDTTTHQVRLMGTSGRRSWVWIEGNWLKLPARSESTLAVSGIGVDAATSSVAGSFRPARI